MITFPIYQIFFITLIKFLEVASAHKSTIIFPDANANGNFNLPKNISTGTSFLEPEDVSSSGGNEFEANYLSNIKDFATFYNFDLPKTDPFRRNSSLLSTRLGGSGGVVLELEQATCTPEKQTVPLDLPQEEGVTYFPTCIRVERCGGCCFLSHHSCQPTAVQKIQVKAVKVGEVVTRSRRRVNRQAEPDYITVEVEQHLQCNCQCRLKESECNPVIHMYSEPRCECLCKDQDKEQACLGSRDHFWSYEQCECLCRKTISCSTGEKFDHKTCRCVNTLLERDYGDLYNDSNFVDYVYYQG